MEVELFGLDGELGHVFLVAARVGGDEVGDELLAQVLVCVDAVEDALELLKEAERGFAHQVENAVGGVFGSHFQPSADMAGNQFAGVLLGCPVGLLVATAVEQQVVAHSAADEAFLYLGQGIDGVIDVEQGRVVGVQIGAYLRMNARGALAPLAGFQVLAMHAVHVGRRSAQVAQVALEVGQLAHFVHFFQDALFRAAGNELALMG